MEDILKSCQCYPHFFQIPVNGTECSLPDLICLQNWNEKWANMEEEKIKKIKIPVLLQCQQCLPTCSYIKYKIRTSYAKIESQLNANNRKRVKLSHTTSVMHVYFGDSYAVQYQQTVVKSWDELLSMFGGLISLMTGASIISVAEFIYFQTGKCFSIFFKNTNKKETKTDKLLEKEYEKIKKIYWDYVYEDLDTYRPEFGKYFNLYDLKYNSDYY